MAASAWILYNKARAKLVNGTLDLDTNVFRVRIFKGQAAASVSVSTLSLLSQIGTTNQAASMSDYPFTGASIKALAASATQKWSVPTLIVTAGATCNSLQYAVCYNSLSAGGGHVLAWCKLSTAAFNVTVGNTLTIVPPANGLLVIY